ncbi:MAG: phosphoglycerate mutase [Candidatus Gottesmanbacteria bacterium GW2011_GWA2_41_12]|uniref:Phosphoglycerate mutase n=2 Tax=Candidatus Gottesmaniibacteriota TaxID=1752720 RepID=A0A0G0UM50_9BACT|nr:MAG: phosphoglycerate mutase [Candidatus Gottesmanbacteria bacterium GW2011_GWC2_39_8]KKR88591.1 MAG: phosphoglycerate mutase [Candidatus Gottesmanbacteria bacterium GW2011_GWA2_41_12]
MTDKKTTVYFIRHGEVDNPRQVLYGRLPGFGITERGQSEVEETGKILKPENIKVLFSSPLKRTIDSAKILGPIIGIKPVISKLLLEAHFPPSVLGMPLVDFWKIEPAIYSDFYYKIGMEKPEEILARMEKFVSYVKSNYPDERVAAVSSADTILILKAKIEGKEWNWDYKKRNMMKTGSFLKLEI